MPVTTVHTAEPTSQALVRIAQGALQGSKVGRLSVFRGVPYATSERFGAPRPVAAWRGVRSAVERGVVCPQLPVRLEKAMGGRTARDVGSLPAAVDFLARSRRQ